MQQTNKRTLIISLPKRWGKAFPVGPGDHIQLDLQADGSVLMRPHGVTGGAPAAAVLGAHGDLARVLDEVTTSYLKGATGLAVVGLSQWPRERLDALRQGLRERFGAEIVDEGNDAVEARFLGADRPEQVEIAGRRLVRLLAEALRGTPVDPVIVERCRLLATRHILQGALESPRHGRIGPIVLHLAALASVVPMGSPERDDAWAAAMQRAGMAALAGARVQVADHPVADACDAWAAAAAHSLVPLAGLAEGGGNPRSTIDA